MVNRKAVSWCSALGLAHSRTLVNAVDKEDRLRRVNEVMYFDIKCSKVEKLRS